MAKARVLLDKTLDISERFRVELKVFGVVASQKHPEGVKARYALIDVVRQVPRLVVDNHAPFGFHAHANLPEAPEDRKELKVQNYLEALDQFWKLVTEVLSHEN